MCLFQFWFPQGIFLGVGLLCHMVVLFLVLYFLLKDNYRILLFSVKPQHDISPEKTYRWLTNTWKDAQHCTLLEKCKSKPQWDITSHQSEWPSSKILQTINAGEGVQKRECSCTDTATMEDSMEIPLTTSNKTTIWPSNPTYRHIPWGSQNWKRHVSRCSFQ